MQTLLPFILAMIAGIVLLNMLAKKLKIAYPILLVVAGLLISIIPGMPYIQIDPDLIFFIFLPPLLFEAAWAGSFKEMRKWWRIITSFAFVVVFFTALSVALITNYFIPGFTIAIGFLWMVVGGVGIGLISAWLFIQAHKRLPTDTSSDIAFTLISPYFMYWFAEQLHASGVLAVVAGGLLMSVKRLTFLTSGSRIRGYSVWELFVFLLNGIVFLLIGLELPDVTDGLHADGIPMMTAIGYGVLVTAILIAARMALAIPLKLESGEAFPHRNLILFITFVAILLTLLVQGLTLPMIIRRTGLFNSFIDDEGEAETRQQMKIGLKQHIHLFLKNKYETEWQGNESMAKFIQQWEERTKATEVDTWMNERTKGIFLEMLESQREYLVELNKDPKINEEIIREQLYQLDLEEERLRIV